MEDYYRVPTKKKKSPAKTHEIITPQPTAALPMPIISSEDESSEDYDIQRKIHSFTSFRSPTDYSWWSFIQNIPKLRPTINKSDPHIVRVTLRSSRPSPTLVSEHFPIGFKAGIMCKENIWLLDVNPIIEIELVPPSLNMRDVYKVHLVRDGDDGPIDWIVIEWMNTEKEDELQLF
eukprot:TRINITY_DN767_c0_g1_i1.p1 TRINITY_DN767_c0_g1~~TRINITY_DN767_c0_g1_i1.p1  ORF type:complete len:176 (+),score=26.18 TRINITY_DN767_c0_g1_i1:623-1150(+)